MKSFKVPRADFKKIWCLLLGVQNFSHKSRKYFFKNGYWRIFFVSKTISSMFQFSYVSIMWRVTKHCLKNSGSRFWHALNNTILLTEKVETVWTVELHVLYFEDNSVNCKVKNSANGNLAGLYLCVKRINEFDYIMLCENNTTNQCKTPEGDFHVYFL